MSVKKSLVILSETHQDSTIMISENHVLMPHCVTICQVLPHLLTMLKLNKY